MSFDANSYFEEICRSNKIAVAGEYRFCRVTGISNMEEVIQNFSSANAYFCIDDTEDGNLLHVEQGPVERRQYTVFLLKKFTYGNMDQQHAALNECRQIYRQTVKRLLHDRHRLADEMIYLRLDRIPFYEIPGYFISGCTGLYFMITVDIPTELCYDGDEWND